jgi:hypothetical protein
MTSLNWQWIALMATVPGVLGGLLAWACWRGQEYILGNLAGAVIILGFALALILRESAEVDRVTRACIDEGYTCWPVPGAFVRYAIYAAIGFVEVVLVFMTSLRVERRIRDRRYAPEWR